MKLETVAGWIGILAAAALLIVLIVAGAYFAHVGWDLAA